MSISISGTGGASAALDQLRDKLFARADADQSGGVSFDEFRELGKDAPAGIADSKASDAARRIFTSLDEDRDGSLTSTELKPPSGFRGPPGGGFGGAGFAPDGLAALLGQQEQSGGGGTTSSGGVSGSLISELLERYRSTTTADRQPTGATV